MIKNIIFDFGDVFINLDKAVVSRELVALEDPGLLMKLKSLNDDFEVGAIRAQEFLNGLKEVFPTRSRTELKNLWNAMLLDFPLHRLTFLEDLAAAGEQRLFLLSNTNELHIPHVRTVMGEKNYQRFRGSFEGFYLSHEIQMRKPNPEIFEFVLGENLLKAGETLFVDDSLENIEAARKMGIKTWHLQVGQEEITALKSRM